MKKLIFLGTFIMTGILNTTAQDVSFGVKGGVNLSNMESDVSNREPLTSFHLGGVMEALYSEKIALQTEILYSEQGFKTEATNEQSTYKLSYVNVPVMIKYFVAKGVFLEAGPQIGFLNSAKITTESDGNSDTEDIKDGLRSNDFSLNAGLGFQFKNGLNFNARYCYGITNIVNRLSDEKFKNRVVQVSIGYLF